MEEAPSSSPFAPSTARPTRTSSVVHTSEFINSVQPLYAKYLELSVADFFDSSISKQQQAQILDRSPLIKRVVSYADNATTEESSLMPKLRSFSQLMVKVEKAHPSLAHIWQNALTQVVSNFINNAQHRLVQAMFMAFLAVFTSLPRFILSV